MAVERAPGGEYVVALADRFEMDDRAFAVVLGVTLLGLVARLVLLGARPMHFDEARVTYWGLRAVRTGQWSYRPAVHGPLVQHLNRWLFAVAGSSDFVARLPVALVGSSLPAAALLLRNRLRDFEVAALAALFAVNPLLLYYSRFMRSDVLVAVFAFVTFGALVRLYGTRRPAYLYAAAGAFALAFSSKENAVVYVLCWVGMFGLVGLLEVVDPRRFASRTALVELVRERVSTAGDSLRNGGAARAALHAVGATVLFLLVVVFLFARRSPPGGVGLWQSGPTTVLKYVVADIACGLEFWSPVDRIPVPNALLPEELVDQSCRGFPSDEGPFETFPTFFGREMHIIGKTAGAVATLSIVGVVSEFRRERPRVLVPAAFYWGIASLLGYPFGTDILFPAWIAVHSVVPLAIPAAAGAVTLGEWTVDEVADANALSATALGLAVLLLVGSTAGAAVHHSYVQPTPDRWSNEEAQMAQFAQPEHAMRHAVDATRRAAAGESGVDVVVYDEHTSDRFALVDMGGPEDHAVGCMKFIYGLPMSWYLYSFEADVVCADNESRLEAGLESNPPVVIVRKKSSGPVRERLGENYVSATYNYRLGSRPVVFFFDTTRVDPPPRATAEDRRPAIE